MSEKLLPKLRTINQLYEDVHTLDENSPISKNFIKKVIIENNIPYISVGVKKMYDENVVFEHIENAFTTQENEENIYNIF
ncbi:MAG: hypothetical protein IJN50_02570 [Clostridia bacterium]|nr:hypothetical protein [Clostridia bacterium]